MPPQKKKEYENSYLTMTQLKGMDDSIEMNPEQPALLQFDTPGSLHH